MAKSTRAARRRQRNGQFMCVISQAHGKITLQSTARDRTIIELDFYPALTDFERACMGAGKALLDWSQLVSKGLAAYAQATRPPGTRSPRID